MDKSKIESRREFVKRAGRAAVAAPAAALVINAAATQNAKAISIAYTVIIDDQQDIR